MIKMMIKMITKMITKMEHNSNRTKGAKEHKYCLQDNEITMVVENALCSFAAMLL